MAQSKPEDINLDQVLKLVEQLSPEDQSELRRKLDDSWSKRWSALVQRIEKRAKDYPPLSDEEILAEVKAAREARKGA
ncbi:MAG: hypothetical protein K2Y22_08030 [Candidatus Obscuribacterales bacterium]|nr:hypothetical protein [Candidatus Obscuribacterales bacterium]